MNSAGFSPFSKNQVEAHSQALLEFQWGNPHSNGPIGNAVLERVQQTRRRILAFLDVTPETHEVIFCAGATAALKLVADCFPWSSATTFAFTILNHNSVVGIREMALSNGSPVVCVDEDYKFLSVYGNASEEDNTGSHSLLAVPAECNFSGIRPDLLALNRIRNGDDLLLDTNRKWAILLDASKYCATSKLSLKVIEADFTVISFYKIFGLPTGLGALIVRRDAQHLLSKKIYFGGGTYDALSATQRFYRSRQDLASRFEDGSIAFTSIDCINYGFDFIDYELGGIDNISKHCSALAAMVACEMIKMKHYNGTNVFEIYGNHFSKTSLDQGPIISFSVLNEAGEYRGYSQIHRLASACGFQIRSGCFCNSGACERFLRLSPVDIQTNLQRGHICGDDIDIIDGRPTGCLRISFGYASTFRDASAWLSFAMQYLIRRGSEIDFDIASDSTNACYIKTISVFPVKSCVGFQTEQWPVSDSGGLLWDRQFALMDDRNRLLSQIKVPSLAKIRARICLKSRTLIAESTDNTCFVCSLDDDELDRSDAVRNVQDCHGIRRVVLYENSRAWFTAATGISCCLIRFLLDNETSGNILVVSDLSFDTISRQNREVPWDLQAFRANIVLKGGRPFSEEQCKGFISDNGLYFEAIRRCIRCTMIGKSQFSELNRLRLRPEFGVIFKYSRSSPEIESCKLLKGNLRIVYF